MSKKREVKSTVSTPDGLVEVKVIIDLTPEDLIEHLAKCAVGDLAGVKVFSEDSPIITKDLKKMLIIKRS